MRYNCRRRAYLDVEGCDCCALARVVEAQRPQRRLCALRQALLLRRVGLLGRQPLRLQLLRRLQLRDGAQQPLHISKGVHESRQGRAHVE